MVFKLGIGLIQDDGFFNLIFAIRLVSIINRLEQKIASLISYLHALEPGNTTQAKSLRPNNR